MSQRTRYAVVTISLALLLAGCSGGSEKDAPPVASLQSAAATSTAAGGGQQPIYPMDATYEQIADLAKPWTDCLKKEGVKKPEEALGVVQKGGDAEDLAELNPQVDAEAWRACDSQRPESFEQHQLRTSPTEFKDNQREWYRCAQAAGYKLTAPDPETGQFGLTEVGPNGDAGSEKMEDCRRKAFAN